MKIFRFLAFFTSFFASTFLFIPVANAALEIEISGGSAQQIPIAIVPFGQGEHAATMSSIIAADLKRSGLFRVLETGGVASRPTDITQIKFAEWSALQAQAMSVGTIEPQADGKLKVSRHPSF